MTKQNTYKSNHLKKDKKKKKGPAINFKFLKDKRFHLSLGYFLFASALFLLIAFVSYLSTGKADQSVVETFLDTGLKGLKALGVESKNWMKLMGALSAHYFIFKWFGIAAFLVPPLLFLLGFKILFKQELIKISRAFRFALFITFWLGTFLGYLLLGTKSLSEWGFLCGGIGFELAFLLNSLMGWGTLILLIFVFIVFNIYFFNITSLLGMRHGVKKHMQNIEDTLEEKITRLTIGDEESNNEEKVVSTETTHKQEESWTVEKQNEIAKKADKNKNEELELAIENVPADHEQKDKLINEKKETKSDKEPEFTINEEKHEQNTVEKVENYDPTLDLPKYQHPSISLMHEYDVGKVQVTKEELEQNKDNIVETLINFKIGISSIKATIGPTVTLYEIVPEAGVKISKIKNLENDIALNLAALGIRIIAPIPGKGTIGIEVPNKNREMVGIRSVITTDKFMKSDKELPIVLGKTISNEVYVTDLTKMPHLLMAGATGQGKSVGLNVILASLIYKKHPSQLKFVLVDPKKVELTLFNKIERHFLAKLPDSEDAIITDTRKVVHTLNSLCIEMDNRYDLLKDAGCRNLKEYNTKFVKRRLNPENGHRFLPYVVLVIDELADLIMTAGKEIETPIARLAQLARAIGIHLVVATQRPSVNVITGIIKANFPARLSFRVTSKVDSRTILDTGGAEQLVGQGDMLLSQGSDIIRLQCAFIDTPEIEKICEFVGAQRGYTSAYLLPEYIGEEGENNVGDVDLSERDAMFEDAARLIVAHQQGSTSLIQRKLKLGYNRAGRLIDQLEAAGIVGPFEGSKAREVLIQDEYALEQLLRDIDNT